MDITYLGHSGFKLSGKNGSVVTDPFSPMVGFSLPKVSADIVTVSHDHPDHNAVNLVAGTARRAHPFIITDLGEYEVEGISVFGVKSYHDPNQGVERGVNRIFTILIDEIRVCHLGDLGQDLTDEQLAQIGSIDVLLCPVGGSVVLNPAQAVKVINSLEPSIVIPMHFKTPEHDLKVFGDLVTVDQFCQEYGVAPAAQSKLSVDKARLPEETELVILQ